MQGHHDAAEGQVIDMQVLDERAPIKGECKVNFT